MKTADSLSNTNVADANASVQQAFSGQRSRLRSFLRRHVTNREDVEDILQDVFYELVVAYQLMKPLENVAAWLFRVARNRMTDRYRKQAFADLNEDSTWTDLLPSLDADPEQQYLQTLLETEIEDALGELPPEQRDVFIWHELEGRSFKEIAAVTGTSINTLLSRKRYAILHLRARLQSVHEMDSKKRTGRKL